MSTEEHAGDPRQAESRLPPVAGTALSVMLEAAYRYGFVLLFGVVALAAGLWFVARLNDSVQQATIALVHVADQLEQQTAELKEIRRSLVVLATRLPPPGNS